MLANYGYSDGSGEYFITIDTDRCDGCGQCVSACPSGVFEILEQDPNDPLREGPVAVVSAQYRNRIKYICASCKPSSGREKLPCVSVCNRGAIFHSW